MTYNLQVQKCDGCFTYEIRCYFRLRISEVLLTLSCFLLSASSIWINLPFLLCQKIKHSLHDLCEVHLQYVVSVYAEKRSYCEMLQKI